MKKMNVNMLENVTGGVAFFPEGTDTKSPRINNQVFFVDSIDENNMRYCGDTQIKNYRKYAPSNWV